MAAQTTSAAAASCSRAPASTGRGAAVWARRARVIRRGAGGHQRRELSAPPGLAGGSGTVLPVRRWSAVPCGPVRHSSPGPLHPTRRSAPSLSNPSRWPSTYEAAELHGTGAHDGSAACPTRVKTPGARRGASRAQQRRPLLLHNNELGGLLGWVRQPASPPCASQIENRSARWIDAVVIIDTKGNA